MSSFKVNQLSKVYRVFIRFKEIYFNKVKNQEEKSYYLIGQCKLSYSRVNYWIFEEKLSGNVFPSPIFPQYVQVENFFSILKSKLCTQTKRL